MVYTGSLNIFFSLSKLSLVQICLIYISETPPSFLNLSFWLPLTFWLLLYSLFSLRFHHGFPLPTLSPGKLFFPFPKFLWVINRNFHPHFHTHGRTHLEASFHLLHASHLLLCPEVEMTLLFDDIGKGGFCV